MDISEKISRIFMDVFHIQDINEVTSLAYRHKGWDSTTHMILVAKVEEAFSIMFEPEDVFSFKSFEIGVQLVSNHLNR